MFVAVNLVYERSGPPSNGASEFCGRCPGVLVRIARRRLPSNAAYGYRGSRETVVHTCATGTPRSRQKVSRFAARAHYDAKGRLEIRGDEEVVLQVNQD